MQQSFFGSTWQTVMQGEGTELSSPWRSFARRLSRRAALSSPTLWSGDSARLSRPAADDPERRSLPFIRHPFWLFFFRDGPALRCTALFQL